MASTDYSGYSDFEIPVDIFQGANPYSSLVDPFHVGTRRRYRGRTAESGRSSKDWFDRIVGTSPMRYEYDYEGLLEEGTDPSILSQLTSAFMGGRPGEDYLSSPFDPTGFDTFAGGVGSESGLIKNVKSPSEWGTGATSFGGKMDLLKYVDIFDPESIAMGLNLAGGLGEGSARQPEEIQALTREMFEKTKPSYYNPLLRKERGSLLDRLTSGIRGVGTGGFAASGARGRGMRGLRDQLRTELGGTIEGTYEKQARAQQDISDVIAGWL